MNIINKYFIIILIIAIAIYSIFTSIIMVDFSKNLAKRRTLKKEADKLIKLGNQKLIYEFYKDNGFNPMKYICLEILAIVIYSIFIGMGYKYACNNAEAIYFPLGRIMDKGSSNIYLQVFYIIALDYSYISRKIQMKIREKEYMDILTHLTYMIVLNFLYFYTTNRLSMYMLFVVFTAVISRIIIRSFLKYKNVK